MERGGLHIFGGLLTSTSQSLLRSCDKLHRLLRPPAARNISGTASSTADYHLNRCPNWWDLALAEASRPSLFFAAQTPYLVQNNGQIYIPRFLLEIREISARSALVRSSRAKSRSEIAQYAPTSERMHFMRWTYVENYTNSPS